MKRILNLKYLEYSKRATSDWLNDRKIIGVELFAQTFDSKRNRVFLSSMSSRLFSIEKRGEGGGGEKEGSSYFLFLSKAIRKLS